MSFWDDYAKTEAARPRPKPPSSQDAPAECQLCGAVDKTVIFGRCARCDKQEQGHGT